MIVPVYWIECDEPKGPLLSAPREQTSAILQGGGELVAVVDEDPSGDFSDELPRSLTKHNCHLPTFLQNAWLARVRNGEVLAMDYRSIWSARGVIAKACAAPGGLPAGAEALPGKAMRAMEQSKSWNGVVKVCSCGEEGCGAVYAAVDRGRLVAVYPAEPPEGGRRYAQAIDLYPQALAIDRLFPVFCP